MRNLILLILSLFVLNSCGDLDGENGNNSNNNDNNSNTDITSLNINNLYLGYTIEGHNVKNQTVRFNYCNKNYTYKRGNEYFSGRFNINNSQIIINMFDAKGGSYIWDTSTGDINVGREYYIYDVSDEIIVDGIYKTNCF